MIIDQHEIHCRAHMFGGRERATWHVAAMNLAFDIAHYRSEDPYTQVGACVLKKDGFEIGLGYNGPPSGININWRDRAAKNIRVLHAESNVLNRIMPGDGVLIAVTHLPCSGCLKVIAQKKIPLVLYCIVIDKYNPQETFDLAKEFGIQMTKVMPTTKNAPETLEYKG